MHSNLAIAPFGLMFLAPQSRAMQSWTATRHRSESDIQRDDLIQDIMDNTSGGTHPIIHPDPG
jgi:hypothetical protein